jgi:Ca2+-binding EF-hand superfamily protein
MKSHQLFTAVLAALVWGFAEGRSGEPSRTTGAARHAAPTTDRDVQDVVYLGDKEPVLIRLHVRIDGKPLVDAWEGFIGELFAYLDVDGDGVVSKTEAGRMPPMPVLFNNGPGFGGQRPNVAVALDKDRDGDSKLFEKEIVAYLDRMKELQQSAMRGCASLSVKDQGRGLFDLVDVNGDGRLGVRELRKMVKLIDQLDRDGDGCISRGEIPHKYRVDVRRGPSQGNPFVVHPPPRIGMNQRSLPDRSGPVWFRKMDRNHDGDVSRREFLGTDEQFRKLDADGDGLISLEEAQRADERLRKEKERKPK